MLLTLFLGGHNDSVAVFGDDDLFGAPGGAVFGEMFSTCTSEMFALLTATVPKNQ